jgi:hypothetical protein
MAQLCRAHHSAHIVADGGAAPRIGFRCGGLAGLGVRMIALREKNAPSRASGVVFGIPRSS